MQQTEQPPAQATAPRQRGWRYWLLRLGRSLLIGYALICLAMWFLQNKVIFPGTSTQGTAESVVRERGGRVVVRLSSADGTPLAAAFAPAHDVPIGEAPTVIFFYGNGMCAAHLLPQIDMLRSFGCNVIVPDYPGYGMSGGSPSENGIYACADAAYDYLASRGDIDMRRIVSMGWSIGAGAAIDLAHRRPCAGLVTFSAFTSLPDMAQNFLPWLPARWLISYRFDNRAKIGQLKMPMLIVHGQRDSIIPWTMSRQLVEATGGRARSLWIDRADHNDIMDVGREQYEPPLRELLDEVRRPRPDAP